MDDRALPLARPTQRFPTKLYDDRDDMSKQQPAMTNVNSGLQVGRNINIHNSTFNQIGTGVDNKNGKILRSALLVVSARLTIKSMPAVARVSEYEKSSRSSTFGTWYGSLDPSIGGVPIMATAWWSFVDPRKSR